MELIDKLDHVRHISLMHPTRQCVTMNVIVKFTQRYPRLQSFVVCREKCLTDHCLGILSEKCHHLEKLHFCGVLNVTEGGMLSIIPINRFLRNVQIGHTRDGVSNSILNALAEHCAHLEALSVYNAENMDDIGLNALSRGCRHLRRISFETRTTFTATGVLSAVDNWNKLVLIRLGRQIDCSGRDRDTQLMSALGEKIKFYF